MRISILAEKAFTCCACLLFIFFSTTGYSQSASSLSQKKVVDYDTIEVEMPDGSYELRLIEKGQLKLIQIAPAKESSENSAQKSLLMAPAANAKIDTIEIIQPDGTIEYRIINYNFSFICNDEKVYEKADIMPEFIGGQLALKKYIAEHLKYPAAAKTSIAGEVTVKFTVDKSGRITDVKAIRFPPKGENLAVEAVRMVRMMPTWQAGKKNGLLVNVRCELPVVFKLKK